MKAFNNFSLKDKVAIVTGGAAGIGKAIAELYWEKGAKVIIVDKNSVDDERFISLPADVSNLSSVEQVVSQAMSYFGKIDILVNSAGIVALAPAEKTSEMDWDKTISVNLKGVFLMSQTVGRYLIQQGNGKIINLASQAGVVALKDHLAYCTSKAGVIGMTKVLALEWGPLGVQVNAISPTVVLTELGRKAWTGEVAEQMKQKIPARRFAYPEEIAACALFLASHSADMITGANLVIDGGYTIQ